MEPREPVPAGFGALGQATIPKTTRPRACREETLFCRLAWEPGQAQPLATHSASSILPPALQAAPAARAAEAPRSPMESGLFPSLSDGASFPSQRALVAALSGPGESWGQPGSKLRAPGRPPAGEGADIQAQSPASGDWWLGRPLPAPAPAAPACGLAQDASLSLACPGASQPVCHRGPWRQVLGRAVPPAQGFLPSSTYMGSFKIKGEARGLWFESGCSSSPRYSVQHVLSNMKKKKNP